ncbi:MAG: MFS transporter [Acidimicrobiales bacterium]
MTTVDDERSVASWRNAILAAFGLGGITVTTWGPRLPTLRADLGAANGTIGIVLSGVTIGALTGLGCSSTILQRLGARRGILGALWLVALGIATIGVGAGVAHALVPTAVGLVGVGVGIGALDVMVNVEASGIEIAVGRTRMPLMHAAWSAGAIVGAGIGAGSAALGLPVQWQFVGEAVLIGVAASVLTRAIPRHAPPVSREEPRDVLERVRGWARQWSDWRLLLIGVVMLGVEMGEGSANNWLSLAVRDDHHQTDAVAALFFVVFATGETLARALGSPLVDRVGRTIAVRTTTAVGVVGMLLFILAQPAWLVLVGTFLWAVGVSMGFPLGMSAAAESGPNPAARVSVVASIGYVANLAGPPVVGLLSEAFGLLDALWLVVALLAVSFALSGALRPRLARERP